jgi:sterol desaturase/sphingolipid hydroxylase (fatty acid hydroxylase superfamily)
MDFRDVLSAPITQFVDMSNRMAWVYLLSALIVAIFAYLIERVRQGKAAQVGLLRWLLPPEVLSHPSAQVDLAYFVINKMLLALIFGSILVTAPLASTATEVVLTALFGPPGPGFQPHWGFTVLTTLTVLLVLDFSLWFMHYVFHKIPFLWDYHKVHHSAEVMTPITAARMHPAEEVLTSIVATLAIGVTYAVLHYALGAASVEVTIFEINIFLAVFYVSAFHLRHSHVWVRFPYWLQHILVCPAQHQIHHSVERRHWDKNMGFIFAFWDWAAGTLYAPKGREELTFGLGTEEDGGTWHSLGALYLLPFRQSWDRLRGRGPARPPVPPSEPAE